jgi:hypothetical protein
MGVAAATTVGQEFVSPESRVRSNLQRELWLTRRQISSWIFPRLALKAIPTAFADVLAATIAGPERQRQRYCGGSILGSAGTTSRLGWARSWTMAVDEAPMPA